MVYDDYKRVCRARVSEPYSPASGRVLEKAPHMPSSFLTKIHSCAIGLTEFVYLGTSDIARC